MRLRRSNPGAPGHGRRRRGRGFTFHDQHGRPVTDPDDVARMRALAIPPAWRDVWICPDPRGHIQATGIDAAGRKQYPYHPVWRAKRDAAKFDHVLDVARRLPRLRTRVRADLRGRGLNRDRVLATVTRLLDSGAFRVGGDEYAAGEEPSYGVATLRPEHLRSQPGCVVVEYVAKGGLQRVERVSDGAVCAILRDLRRRRRGAERLFAYWDGRQWRDVRSDDVNAYLREVSGADMTAKDFRTWHATVLAAASLAAAGPQRSATARKRAVSRVMREVAEQLGNTPTVARSSYVDPRVVDLFEDGVVAEFTRPRRRESERQAAEHAVLRLLADETGLVPDRSGFEKRRSPGRG
ncbi:MAG TPA: DNA topoisomerase IB [Pilimelia sp.]|nr:DNA topoisomerase IB [Pilimelia sp.]